MIYIKNWHTNPIIGSIIHLKLGSNPSAWLDHENEL